MKKFKVRIDGREYHVEVEREGEKIVEAGEERKEKEIKEKILSAPMPAKVIKVNCKAGEKVKQGDVLVIIEAMKMENEILSPGDGTIKDVMVEEGTNVSQDERMITFE